MLQHKPTNLNIQRDNPQSRAERYGIIKGEAGVD